MLANFLSSLSINTAVKQSSVAFTFFKGFKHPVINLQFFINTTAHKLSCCITFCKSLATYSLSISVVLTFGLSQHGMLMYNSNKSSIYSPSTYTCPYGHEHILIHVKVFSQSLINPAWIQDCLNVCNLKQVMIDVKNTLTVENSC